ncbi:MAG: geranylgeranylglyceryl/heptaprenylglyceryl phosphate synthase [Bacteroidetes bacterium]|nr:geranylgeranylglyceryl/heptaprenylglyceryl phosphate synthase [Bacteroidota bacterium]
MDAFIADAGAGQKRFALLLDPAHVAGAGLPALLEGAAGDGVDYLFIGGSLANAQATEQLAELARRHSTLPVILFPGSPQQLTHAAHAVFFLSLISGRNPEYLIGHHVAAAAQLEHMALEVLPTGYLLVDCGRPTSASYISNTQPLPYDKPELARYTALAGQYLGLQLLYLDGGSGAMRPISPRMIQAVRAAVQVPLIVGGGLRTAEDIAQALAAGADVVVVGTALEQDPKRELLRELTQAVRGFIAAG